MRLEFGHRLKIGVLLARVAIDWRLFERLTIFPNDAWMPWLFRHNPTFHPPHVDIAKVVTSNKTASFTGDCHASYRHVFFWDEVVAASVLRKVPHFHTSSLVAADNFSLIRMDDDVVDGAVVVIPSLCFRRCSDVPDLECPVFASRGEPFGSIVPGQ